MQKVLLNTGAGWSSDTNNTWTTSLRSISFQDKKMRRNGCPITVVDGGPEKAIFVDRRPLPNGASFPSPNFDASYPQSWQLVDLNGDGYADLIASYLVGYGYMLCSPGTTPGVQILEVWLNDRQGGWVRDAVSNDLSSYRPFGALAVEQGAFPVVQDYHPFFGEFDGDGLADLAVGVPTFAMDACGDPVGNPVPGSSEIRVLGGSFIERSPFSGFSGSARILPSLGFTHVFESNCGDPLFGGPALRHEEKIAAAFVDLNGDGLTDYVRADAFPRVVLGKRGGGSCSSLTDCPEAARYQLPVPLLDTYTFIGQFGDAVVTQPEDTGVRLTDINGDGWTDVVQARLEVRPTGTTSVRRAFLYDPSATSTSVWKEDPRYAPRNFDVVKTDFTIEPALNVPRSFIMGHQFVDIDSDGADDVLYAGGKKMSQSTLPDLVSSFDNGRGGVIGFAHATDVRQRVTADPTPLALLDFFAALNEQNAPGVLGLPLFPLYSTPRFTKRPVVVAQTLRNMAEVGAADVTSEFLYVRPGFSLENRTSLGFAGVGVQRPDGALGMTFFYQQKGVAGRMQSTGTARLTPSFAFLSSTVQDYAVVDGALVPGSAAGVPVARLTRSKQKTFYPDADPMPVDQFNQVTSLTYNDSYGYNFVSSVTEQRNTSQLVRTLTPTPASSFITPTTYVPGLPASVEQRDHLNRVLSRSDFGYDAVGRTTSVTALIQARDNPGTPTNRVTEIGYDVYGNVRSKSTGAVAGTPLVTEFICYDGDTALGTGMCPNPSGSLNSHSLVVGMRDALGKITNVIPNATTGLPERAVAFNGDIVDTVFDRFGRVTERAVDPIRGSVARTILERRNYGDFYFPAFIRPYTETFVRTGNGTEEIRRIELPDGFGRLERFAEQTPSGYAGKVITRDPATRTVRETFMKPCTNLVCADLTATVPASSIFPATITTLDALGRAVKVEEWGDAQTLNSVTLAKFGRENRAQPTGFTPTGASTFFDVVLAKNAKGDLTRRIVDGDRVVWSEECANTVPASTSSLDAASCGSADVSYFVYDATGEQVRLYDPIAYPSGPFDNPDRYVGFAFDTLGRRISASDPDGGTTRSVFNVLDLETQTTNARNQSTLLTYDLLGRVKTINRPGTEPDSTLTYSDELASQGNRGLARVVNTSAGIAPTQEDFQYDPFDNLSYRKASFTVSGTTTALVTQFQSDLLGRRTRIDYPDASTSVGYTYTGNVLTRVCELNSSGACAVDYLSSVQYDSLGRESKAFGPVYSAQQSLTPHQITTYDPKTYRVAHQELATVQSLQGNTDARMNFDYQYDALGNVTAIDDLNPTSVAGLAPFSDASYTYDSRNRLTSRTLGGAAKYYKYDRLGNLTGNLLPAPTSTANQSYSDPQRPHAIQSAGSTTFAYDADGNMTRRGTQYLGYSAENKLTCSGTSSTSCTTVQLGYDALGQRASELTSAGATFYVGDLFEYARTSRVGTAHIFALGREVAFKKIPTVTLRTDVQPWGLPPGGLPQVLVLLLLGASGVVIAVALVRAGAPRALARRPALASSLLCMSVLVATPPQAWASAFPPAPSGVYRRWLSSDQVSSALYVFDEQGRRAHKRVFEPFGGIFAEVSSETTPRQFATHLFDASLGLYYMQARFYDPNVGRFTSIDPVIRDPAAIESVNPYSYVENNPVNGIDPDGLCSPGDAGDCNVNLPPNATVIQGRTVGFDSNEAPIIAPFKIDIVGDDGRVITSSDPFADSRALDNALRITVEIGAAFVPFGSTALRLAEGDVQGAAIEAGIEVGTIAVAALTFGLGALALKGIRAARAARAAKAAARGAGKAVPRSLGAAAARRGFGDDVLQTGGRTLASRTARAINEFAGTNVPRRELGRMFERLKADALLPNDFQGKFTRQGDLLDLDGNFIGNVFDFLP